MAALPPYHGPCPFAIDAAEVIFTFSSVASHRSLDAATTAEVARRINAEVGTLASLEDATGGCPSRYDGQDITYTFAAGDTTVSVDNCTKVIPGDNALLRYVDAVLGLPPGPV